MLLSFIMILACFHIFESTVRVILCQIICYKIYIMKLRSVIITADEIDKLSADIKVEIGCGANKVHGKYKIDRRHAYDRMFDLGRQCRHLQTSRLSIDSGGLIALSVDQPLSIMYTSHRIIQGPRGVGSYWKILVVNAQYLLLPINL